MSKPPVTHSKLSDTLSLCECKIGGPKGFWLYDKTRGMNLSMRAASETEAFVEALHYYQKRLLDVECELKRINASVDAFVEHVRPSEDAEDE